MRIRYPFAGEYGKTNSFKSVSKSTIGAFAALVVISGYVGLSSLAIPAVNDKLLHFLDFFLLTVS